MSQFMGTTKARLDRKGRVSVPAQFRAVLARMDSPEIILRPSHREPCIEAWPRPLLDASAEPMGKLDMLSDTADDLAAVLYGSAVPATPDAEGRIVLPDHLIQYANLERDTEIGFIGLGAKFHIWVHEAGLAWLAAAQERARTRNLTVPRA